MVQHTANKNETKQKLITVAMDMFRRESYATVTIEKICEAVGISKNTYYYYFDSKDSLLLAYLFQQKTLTPQALIDALIVEKNPFEQFWSIQKKRIDVLLDCGIEIICHLRNMTTVSSVFNSQHKEEYICLETKIISEAQADGSVRNQTDSNSLVPTSAMMFFGVLSIWIAMDGIFDFELAVRSGYESLFDVQPALRRGGDLYECIMSAAKKRSAGKETAKEKIGAR